MLTDTSYTTSSAATETSTNFMAVDSYYNSNNNNNNNNNNNTPLEEVYAEFSDDFWAEPFLADNSYIPNDFLSSLMYTEFLCLEVDANLLFTSSAIGVVPRGLRCSGDPVGLNTKCSRWGDMLQVRRHRWPNRRMPRVRSLAADIGDRIGAVTSGMSGVRRRIAGVGPGHYCQIVQNDVAWTIVGPAEQALLTTHLRCLVRIRGTSPGYSMSGVLDEWHQRGDQVTSHSCTREDYRRRVICPGRVQPSSSIEVMFLRSHATN
ncbi:hypothetical protein TIFTF001_027134 [Ficus carica]|uniref:Uncharacterized protein n=1 Tax=Ficus carica TaxID=3494 RepID=A0AA88IZR8_FICCA|nr:hypothetical protein TIFTF001_027134 [Ficus carica]